MTRSERAGLVFPVGRTNRFMGEHFMNADKFPERIDASAPVFMTAVLEYLTAEIIELAGYSVQNHKRHRMILIPPNIFVGIKGDEELNAVFFKESTLPCKFNGLCVSECGCH